jgi:hypothetical protein
MSSTENLWGDIPVQPELRAPLVILREQASKLSELTNMFLLGDVQIERRNANLSMTLSIRVPSLDNYEYEVLRATHGALMYPVNVYDLNQALGNTPGWEPIKCENEAGFKTTLTQILRSETVHKVISSLLAQTKL